MIDRIKELESIALRLEPSPEIRAELLDRVVSYADNFINNIYKTPAFVSLNAGGMPELESGISENPGNIDKIIGLIKQNVDGQGLNPASGGHLGYIPGGGIFYSALGDYLADITNRFAGLYFAGPGAVRMEHLLLEWMAELIGYPKGSGGNLTSGGSIANLTGIVTARDAFDIRAKDFERSVIYLTKQAHHSIDKAIRIAGLKECVVRPIPFDENYRMQPEMLEQQICADKKGGLNPFLIIASAGTTDVGAVDPLDAIGDISRRHQLWYHIDGAYGAFFILCKEAEKMFRGVEKSDSLVMDPHKGLFLPYGTGAVIVKEKQNLFSAFWYQANYMQDAMRGQGELSPADLSPELTKHFRGLRLWLPLKLVGLAPFRAALEEKLLLARYFYEKIRTRRNFEVGPYPDLSVVTFRYLPGRGDVNLFNQKLVESVQKDGRIFISSTTLNGNYTVRLAVLSFRTHLPTIDLVLDILNEKIADLEDNQ